MLKYRGIQDDEDYSNLFYYQRSFSYQAIREDNPSTSNDNHNEYFPQVSSVSTAQLPNISDKNQIDKQRDTKNLTTFYCRAICDHILTQQDLPKGFKRKLKKMRAAFVQNANIWQFKSFLKNKLINQYAKNYITSFEFLHYILSGNKLQDVRPIIKYWAKLFEAIEDPLNFKAWK